MATFALLAWPLLALVFFANMAFVRALVLASIVPYLFLPEAFFIPLPGLPDINKTASISLGLLLGFFLFGKTEGSKDQLPKFFTDAPFIRVLVILLTGTILLGFVLTVLGNAEPLRYGETRLPGLRPWDVVGMLGDFGLSVVPFFFAWRFMPHQEAHRIFLKAVVVWALVYSVLMLIEIRFSPQLHNWMYGYHQHSFLQHIRDGFRPKVFLQHGIWVGFFVFTALLSAVGLWKSEKTAKWLLAAAWLFFILMISENLGALVIGVLFLGLFLLFWTGARIAMITIVAFSVLTYPYLRQAEVIPIDGIVNLASLASEERAASLQFRVDHENELLHRVALKPWVGWGPWGRERVFDEDGRDLTVSDGRWIQTLGQTGWIGYIGRFGLLTFPLLTLWFTYRRRGKIPHETMALALICSGNLVYMIPNSTLTVLGWMAFGALAGFAQFNALQNTEDHRPQLDHPREKHRYTRFPNGIEPRGGKESNKPGRHVHESQSASD